MFRLILPFRLKILLVYDYLIFLPLLHDSLRITAFLHYYFLRHASHC